MCFLEITWPNGERETGTGAVVAKKSILTAGHCVYQVERGGYATKIIAYPGHNGKSSPLGSYTSSTLTILSKWRTEGGAAYDAAFIRFSTNIGNNTGIMGYGNYSDSDLLSNVLRVTGYPGDKTGGTLWKHGGKPSSLTPLVIKYKMDAVNGQSGAPVYKRTNNQIVGVHSRGNSKMNYGKRIDSTFFSLMRTVKQEDQ